MDFEWDNSKELSNQKEHSISFAEGGKKSGIETRAISLKYGVYEEFLTGKCIVNVEPLPTVLSTVI